MPYEVYKILHFASIFVALGSLAIGFSSKESIKWVRILAMAASFLILVSGFGLLARLGVHDFPLWVKTKVILWGVLGIMGPVTSKRMQNNRIPAFYFFAIIATLAGASAVLKF